MTNRPVNDDDDVIDLLYLAKCVWHRAWAVVLAILAGGVAGFVISAFAISPLYSSSILLYVNSSDVNIGSASFSISSSEISAARSLVETYAIILNNRTTLEEIADRAKLSYTYEQLGEMVEADSANDTEIMKVTVTCTNPETAATIANCIAEVLPERIASIISGASMEVVDSAVPDYSKISPSITKYTAMGMLIGAVISVGIIVLLALLDNTIHDEDYIIQSYGFPILARVPDLIESSSGKSKYGYYSSYGKQ